MASVFAWVDFAEEDRRKMAEVIDLFREQDTRDELGLGVIRDALADLMFPGTSTIQTRARYFLFVPWIYQRHVEKCTPGHEITRLARRDENKLIDALAVAGERDGVIGIDKRAELQRPASNIYWAGLGTWGIRRFKGSQGQYHRAWDSLLRQHTIVDDDKELVNRAMTPAWDPELPEAPSDFLNNISLALTRRESEYLQQRILGLGQTLLGYLISRNRSIQETEFVWMYPGSDNLPAPFKEQVEQARFFSEAMHGAALLYNLMLSQERQNPEWIDLYKESFYSWSVLINNRREDFRSWRRDKFWALVEGTQVRVSFPTRRFVDTWLNLIQEPANPFILADSVQASALIREREHLLKRSRARLGNHRALERWNGAAGNQQLNYRWHRVRTILADILLGTEGLEHA